MRYIIEMKVQTFSHSTTFTKLGLFTRLILAPKISNVAIVLLNDQFFKVILILSTGKLIFKWKAY
jgi:hypothetical protein